MELSENQVLFIYLQTNQPIELSSLLAKAGATLKKYNGFSLIEVLVSFGIVTMLIITVLPISIQVKKEQQILADRLTIVTMLYDELQLTIWNQHEIPKTYNKYSENIQLYFQFTSKNDLTQGCVEWTNVKNEKEKSCLYGHIN